MANCCQNIRGNKTNKFQFCLLLFCLLVVVLFVCLLEHTHTHTHTHTHGGGGGGRVTQNRSKLKAALPCDTVAAGDSTTHCKCFPQRGKRKKTGADNIASNTWFDYMFWAK